MQERFSEGDVVKIHSGESGLILRVHDFFLYSVLIKGKVCILDSSEIIYHDKKNNSNRRS